MRIEILEVRTLRRHSVAKNCTYTAMRTWKDCLRNDFVGGYGWFAA